MTIDRIGTIYRDDAVCGPQGELLTPATALTGYHVNVTPDEMTDVLESFRRSPPRLKRVFAGDDSEAPEITVALRFADKAEADANLPEGEP